MSQLFKVGLPLLLFGGLLAFYLIQPKGPVDIHLVPTEVSINASRLYAAFEKDEAAANGAYVGKVIEVSGQLSAVERGEDGIYQLKIAADNPLGQVICSLVDGSPATVAAATIGAPATVKGICTGYLFDVVIDNATLLPAQSK